MKRPRMINTKSRNFICLEEMNNMLPHCVHQVESGHVEQLLADSVVELHSSQPPGGPLGPLRDNQRASLTAKYNLRLEMLNDVMLKASECISVVLLLVLYRLKDTS